MPTPAPAVYISSSAAAAAFCDRLVEALERAEATVVRAAGDSAATGLTPGVEQELADADACVVLLSADALASERIEREARRFDGLCRAEPQRLLVPVLLAGAAPDAVWPFLRDYTPLAATGTGTRDDEALIAEVLRRLDLLLRVDTVVMPAIPAPGAVPAGLDLAKAPPPVVGGAVEAADAEVLPTAGAESEVNGVANAGTATGGSLAARLAMWRLNNRRNAILILAAALLALALCAALSLGLLARGDHSSNHAGSHALAPASTNAAGQTPSMPPTGGSTPTTSVTASPDPASTQGTGAPTATATATGTATATPVTQPGLWGDYYTSTPAGTGTPPPTFPAQNQVVCHEVDPDINYPTRKSFGCRSLTNKANQTSAFAVKWHGYITVPSSGSYTFYTYSDDGISVIVNGQQLIYNWTIHAPTWNCSTTRSGCSAITLQAGQLYPIEVDYYENGDGSATIQLCWQAPDLQHDIVPPSAFSHA